jgi:hypothetical protein
MERLDVSKTKGILKLVAEDWKRLTDGERAAWDEESREDKLRYVSAKAAFKGPWNLPKRRAKKHPDAPKRPMSAFLKYSQRRRTMIKQSNPDMGNTDISQLLGEEWRNVTTAERAPYVGSEECERAKYKEMIKQWRDDQAQLDAAGRTSHQTVQHINGNGPTKEWRVLTEQEASIFEPFAVNPVEAFSISGNNVFRTHKTPIGDATNRHHLGRTGILEHNLSKDGPRSIRSYAMPPQGDAHDGQRYMHPYYHAPRPHYRPQYHHGKDCVFGTMGFATGRAAITSFRD